MGAPLLTLDGGFDIIRLNTFCIVKLLKKITGEGTEKKMSDLYTSIMEKVMPVLQENWQLAIIGFGLLFILGGIFNWKWTWNPNGHRTFGFNAWVYRTFGEKGARINTALTGVVIIVCGGVMWALM